MEDRSAPAAAVGLDLNGIQDRCVLVGARGETAVCPPGPIVVPVSGSQVLTGDEAFLSFQGRGWSLPPGAAGTRPRLPVLEMIRCIGRKSREDIHAPEILLGHHIRSLVPKRSRSCVLAVPDLPDYGEDVRDGLIEGANRVGLDLKLLWRPVAAVLGWGTSAQPNELARLHGTQALVVQILPDGIAAAGLGLEILSFDGGPAVVPVRRRNDLRDVIRYDGGDLSAVLDAAAADEADGDSGLASQILWSTRRYWNALVGLDAADGLVRSIDGRWLVVDGRRTLPDLVSGPMDRAIREFCERHAPKLREAQLVVVEGPLASAIMGDAAEQATPLAALVQAIGALRPEGSSPVVPAPPQSGLVALGCAVYADRRARGLTAYFDFLPAMEINAIREGRHHFVHLVEPSARVEGGTTYARSLLDRFEIMAGTEELEFYLLKQDEAAARRSLVRLPRPPTSDVRVEIHVTQVPAQGHARVEVRPETADALGTVPVLLDWSRMEVVDVDREVILRRLNEKGSYPGVTPQEAHVCLWTWVRANGSSLKRDLAYYLEIGTPEAATAQNYDRFIGTRLSKTFAIRTTPKFATAGADPDQRPYTLFSSTGRPPPEIEADPAWAGLLQAALEKLDADYSVLQATFAISPVQQRILRTLRRIATFTFGSCPPAVRQAFRQMCLNDAPDGRATIYMGRVLCADGDLAALFSFVSKRALLSRTSGRALNSDLAKAAADALAFHERAGAILKTEQADELAEFAAAMLEECKGVRRPQKYAGALRLVAFLLRHRIARHDFLYPEASELRIRDPGRRIEKQLKAFRNKTTKISYGPKHDDAIDEILALFRHRGKGLRIDIDDEGEDEEE